MFEPMLIDLLVKMQNRSSCLNAGYGFVVMGMAKLLRGDRDDKEVLEGDKKLRGGKNFWGWQNILWGWHKFWEATATFSGQQKNLR